jgi:hypothetical protein
MNRYWIVLALVMAACSRSAAPKSSLVHREGQTTGKPRYDQVIQKGSHNSYERQESLFDQLAFNRVRALELDLHVSLGLDNAPAGDWYVYHSHLGDASASHCEKLSQCLAWINTYHRAEPNHEPITIWFEMKDGFNFVDHGPIELDAQLRATFGDAAIFAPRDLLANCSEQRWRRCPWPSLDQMAGKLIFVIPDTGDDNAPLPFVLTYGPSDAVARTRAGFIAPDVSRVANHQFDSVDWTWYSAFTNINGAPGTGAVDGNQQAAIADGFITRNVTSSDGPGIVNDFTSMECMGMQQIATDWVDAQAPGHEASAINRPQTAWPFKCRPGVTATATDCDVFAEDDDVMSIGLSSEDLGDGSTPDNIAFAFLNGGPTVTWSAFISSGGASEPDWSKGCIMARQSLAPNAPYFAVCRPNDVDQDPRLVRVQWRVHAGENYQIEEFPAAVANPRDQPSFVRYQLSMNGSQVCATGFVSTDGRSWTASSHSPCFDSPLLLQGISASSHGLVAAHFDFGNLHTSGMARSVTAFDFQQTQIGVVRWAQLLPNAWPQGARIADKTCANQGLTCGSFVDQCGATVSCGAPCCTPTGCNGRCGSVDDGCGGTLWCGNCCVPTGCNGRCGSVSDGCGGTIWCGNCCVPTGCNGRCGSVDDGCGGTTWCGDCCVPTCGSGSCGTDDGCGGTCPCFCRPPSHECSCSDGSTYCARTCALC